MLIESVVAANGNIALAAERNSMSPQHLLTTLAQDPTTATQLQYHLRILSQLQILRATHLIQNAFESTVADLSPAAVARTYIQLLELLQQQPQQQAIDVQAIVLKLLPQDVREAVQLLDTDTYPDSGPSP